MLLPGSTTLSELEAISSASTREELFSRMEAFFHRIGFDRFSAEILINTPERRLYDSLLKVPDGYTFEATPQDFARDPLLNHMQTRAVPLIWGFDTYRKANALDLWEAQEPWGYVSGIVTSVSPAAGIRWRVGGDRDKELPNDQEELTRMAAALQLLSTHSQEAALRILGQGHPPPDSLIQNQFHLTPREIELLKWTMEGKTSGEVASIIGITERTVNMHANHVIRKLNCANKLHAVVKAMKLGLI